MSFMDRMVKNLSSFAPRFKKRRFDPEAISIEDINLPLVLMKIDINKIRSMVEDEVKTYFSLGYKNSSIDQLKQIEFHSFQVGVLLRYIKENRVLRIYNLEDLLPTFILKATKKQLHIKVFGIVYRYDKSVPKTKTEDQLMDDIRWSPLEVGYLLRYIDMENRQITKS